MAKIEEIEKMSLQERWQYWKSELDKCIRCYACRAACPLCYCNRCITEVNCPQWLDPWKSTLSNMEWQINRVMHMSGRCTGCGACAKACPLDLPIGILTKKMAKDVKELLGTGEGGNVLSTFNPNDKENFIH
jgi:ferredoxin